MTLREYIELAKKELDSFEETWIEESENNPSFYPMEMDEGEWVEQELAIRFSSAF